MRPVGYLFTLTLLLTALAGATLVAAPPAERVLTLENTLTAALHNSQELLALQEQIFLAQHRISEARSQIYPKIDFSLTLAQFDNDVPTVLSPSFNSAYLPAQSSDLYYFTRFSLWQYLYAGGRYSTNLRLAEINLSQAQSLHEAAKNRVIKEAKAAFYAVLAARERARIYEEALDELASLEGKTPLPRERGLRLRRTLASTRHELAKATLAYLATVGLELDTAVDVTGTLTAPQEEYDLNKCLAWAHQYRPELRKTQFEETMDSLKVNLSLTERYPTVTLGANYERLGGGFPLSEKNWNATLNLNVPIFDGWASWARIKQRKNQAREGKIRRSTIEDRIRFEVREAYLDYTFWQKEIVLLSEQQGKSNDFEEKVTARLLLVNALEKALKSLAALEWATGKPLE